MNKLLRFACVALLTGALVVACDDDEAVRPVTPVAPPTPTAPAPIFGTVSGTVSVEGSGLSGVSVNLLGAASQSASTGSSGGYSFGNVPAGTHGVQISGAPAEVAFVTTATVVTITTSGQTATADFSGNYIRTSTITGSVTAGSEGIVATVTASGSGMLMNEEPAIGSSDTDGNFELTGLRSGTYHVTISDFGDIEFPVTTRDVTVGVGLSANVSFSAPGEDQPTTGGTDAFLVITGITDDDDADTYSGRVTATVDIERGDARFEKITLYVDAAEVASQSFGLAPAPAEDPELAAQQTVFSLSFDSDEYDQTGAVAYPNGAHDIVVGLTVQGSTEEAFSNRMEVEFDNEDGVHALAILPGDPVFNSDTGEGWYGGPDAAITVAAILVSYSGDVVGSLTLLDVCGNKPITASEAPFVFEPECDDTRVLTQEDNIFRIAEREVGILNGEGVFPLRLDFEGPGAPRFGPNPNGREAGWINATVDLTGKYSKTNKDGWLVSGASGGGVGGNALQLRYSTTTPSIVDGALAAEASSEPTLPAATKKATDICFIASAVDLLGNKSALPDDGDACANAAMYTTAVDALEVAEKAENDDAIAKAQGDIPAGLRAGVDVTAPTIEFTANSLKDESRALDRAYDLRVKDDGSDLHSMPVLARVAVRDAKETTCGDDKDGLPGYESLQGDCKNNTEGLGELDDDRVLTELHKVKDLDDGYYTFTALAQDKAGNKSGEISRVALSDDTAPLVSLGITTGTKKGDLDHNLVGTVTDALSIQSYSIAALVDGVYYGLESEPVDAYDADPTTTSVPLDEAVTLPFLGVQAYPTAPGKVSMLRVSASDQANTLNADADPVIVADLAKSAAFTSNLGFKVMGDGDSEANTLEIEAEVTSKDNPFESVLFYAAADEKATDLRFIDEVPEYSARESGGKWTYTARVSADDFYAAVDGDGDYDGKVFAVGVRAAGSVAGTETATTVTTTTNDAGRKVETAEDGKITSTENVYTGVDVTAFTTMVDSDVATDGTTDDDVIIDNDFDNALSTLALPATDDGTMPAVRAEVEITTFATDDGGTTGDDAGDDDVMTRTRVTEHTIVTLTSAGTAQVGTSESADFAPAVGTTAQVGTPASADYKAALPAGGTVQTFTTTDILVGRPGATIIAATTAAEVALVASEDLGRPVPVGASVDVTIAIEAPDPGVAPTVTDANTRLADPDNLAAIHKGGKTTTTISGSDLVVVVSTSVAGEASTVEGGLGLKSEGAPQKVDER